MSRAAVSVFVAGFYALILSLTFFSAPDVALKIFGLPAHKDYFVYIAAMFLLFIAGYFIVGARGEATGVFQFSVAHRFAVPLFIGALVALNQASVNLLLFTPPDVLLGLWTLLALFADARNPRPKLAGAAV